MHGWAIVAATDPNMLRNVLWHWDHPGETPPAAGSAGEKASAAKDSNLADASAKSDTKKDAAAEFTPTRTLAENAKFSGILRECHFVIGSMIHRRERGERREKREEGTTEAQRHREAKRREEKRLVSST